MATRVEMQPTTKTTTEKRKKKKILLQSTSSQSPPSSSPQPLCLLDQDITVRPEFISFTRWVLGRDERYELKQKEDSNYLSPSSSVPSVSRNNRSRKLLFGLTCANTIFAIIIGIIDVTTFTNLSMLV